MIFFMLRKPIIIHKRRILSVFLGIFFMQIIIAQQQNLDYFLKTGLQNSPLLKDYNNRIKSALIDSMRIKAGQGIQVNASSVNSWAPVVRGWGYDEVKTDIAQLSAVVQVSKEVTWSKNLQNKYQAIRLQNQAALLESSISARDLKNTIISQYLLAYNDQQLYELNSEVLALLRQEEQIVRGLTENGFYRQTEYLSLMVNIRQQELIADQYGFQFRTDLETLNYLCGINDTTRFVLAAPDLTPDPSPGIRNTLFYRQFVIDSLKLLNAGRQIDLNYQPKLSIFADGGYLSSLASTPWKNFGISAGLSLTVPIYDGKQKKMQHDQVTISESTRSNYQNFFENQYSQQIILLIHQLASIELITEKTLEQLTYTQALVDANRALLNTGDISVTDYLLSVNNYLNAKNLLIEKSAERFRIINELNYWREK
jgi:outer membrane protein TolC